VLSQRQRVVPRNIEEEIKESYLAYSMSTIVDRALPDARDGLKPSQRRILVAMNDLKLGPRSQHRKCAKIAGDTSGNYHPHGESAVYPTLVRLAQSFSLRYPLVDGQGNFGSIDGYPPAAMRYTEARMAAPAMEILEDLDKDTVDVVPNYDETRTEPAVLPSKFPNLICNGSWGISVAMTSKIPPQNLTEVVDALVALIDSPDLEVEDLMHYIKGPDFPTGAIIYGIQGVRDAYTTGTGSIALRARVSVETLKGGRTNIVVTEIPYMTNKGNLLEKMGDLVRDRKIEGVSTVRDESDRDGLRIVVELKKEAYPNVVLNQLYKHTELQTTFAATMVALVDGRPRVLTLKQILEQYLEHRHAVVVRRTQFELAGARKRAHILEGLRIALAHLDEIIRIIRGAPGPQEAAEQLMSSFDLTEAQTQAILALTLQRLTRMEQKKLDDEYLTLIKRIAELEGILDSRARRMEIVKTELEELRDRYGDERRTQIVYSAEEFGIEDLIADEEMVITITHTGYIKRLPISTYRRQRRGGRGVTGMTTKEEDFVEHLFVASTHSYILFLTNTGRCYWLKVYEIPQGGRAARGRPIVNLLQVRPEERIAAIVPVKAFEESLYLVSASRRGQIKKTPLSDYGHPRRDGIIAMNITDGDELIEAKVTDGTQEIVLSSRKGQALRFQEADVREMGRATQGVRGIRLRGSDEVIGMTIVRREGTLLSVCENGHGKRTQISDYSVHRRGGLGVISIKANERNGDVVAVKEVVDDDELMIISQNGILIRLPIRDISTIGRNTQGVRLINLDPGDKVIDVARIATKEEVEEEEVTGQAA